MAYGISRRAYGRTPVPESKRRERAIHHNGGTYESEWSSRMAP
jgi:hypothetical protein